MRITEDFQNDSAEQAIFDEEGLQMGAEEMLTGFVEAEVYTQALLCR